MPMNVNPQQQIPPNTNSLHHAHPVQPSLNSQPHIQSNSNTSQSFQPPLNPGPPIQHNANIQQPVQHNPLHQNLQQPIQQFSSLQQSIQTNGNPQQAINQLGDQPQPVSQNVPNHLPNHQQPIYQPPILPHSNPQFTISPQSIIQQPSQSHLMPHQPADPQYSQNQNIQQVVPQQQPSNFPPLQSIQQNQHSSTTPTHHSQLRFLNSSIQSSISTTPNPLGTTMQILKHQTTTHPCLNPNVTLCFSMISAQMNRTEEMLKMANRTLALKPKGIPKIMKGRLNAIQNIVSKVPTNVSFLNDPNTRKLDFSPPLTSISAKLSSKPTHETPPNNSLTAKRIMNNSVFNNNSARLRNVTSSMLNNSMPLLNAGQLKKEPFIAPKIGNISETILIIGKTTTSLNNGPPTNTSPAPMYVTPSIVDASNSTINAFVAAETNSSNSGFQNQTLRKRRSASEAVPRLKHRTWKKLSSFPPHDIAPSQNDEKPQQENGQNSLAAVTPVVLHDPEQESHGPEKVPLANGQQLTEKISVEAIDWPHQNADNQIQPDSVAPASGTSISGFNLAEPTADLKETIDPLVTAVESFSISTISNPLLNAVTSETPQQANELGSDLNNLTVEELEPSKVGNDLNAISNGPHIEEESIPSSTEFTPIHEAIANDLLSKNNSTTKNTNNTTAEEIESPNDIHGLGTSSNGSLMEAALITPEAVASDSFSVLNGPTNDLSTDSKSLNLEEIQQLKDKNDLISNSTSSIPVPALAAEGGDGNVGAVQNEEPNMLNTDPNNLNVQELPLPQDINELISKSTTSIPEPALASKGGDGDFVAIQNEESNMLKTDSNNLNLQELPLPQDKNDLISNSSSSTVPPFEQKEEFNVSSPDPSNLTEEKLQVSESPNDLISNSNSVLSPEAVNGDYHVEQSAAPNPNLNSLTIEEIESVKVPDQTQRKGIESEASKLEPEGSPNEEGFKMTHHKRLKTKKALHHSKPDQNKIEDDSIASNVFNAKKHESSKKPHASNIKNGPKKLGRRFGKGKQKHVIFASQDYAESSQGKKTRPDKDVRTRLKLPNAFETKDSPSPPSSSLDYVEPESTNKTSSSLDYVEPESTNKTPSSLDYVEPESTTPPSPGADYDATESANETSSKVENSTVPINNTKIEPAKNATKEAKNDKGSSAKIVL